MAGPTGFVRRSTESTESEAPSFTSKKSAPFVDKKTTKRFALRLFPAIPGYEPSEIAYHIETAIIRIKGKETVWKVRTRCLGKPCPKCASNLAVYKQSKNVPYEIKDHTGQFFMGFVVYPNQDGSYGYSEKNEPHRFEYKFRYKKMDESDSRSWKLICEDWDNFMDAYEAAVAKGIDPTDPETGILFEVEYAPQDTGAASKKDYWIHRPLLDKTLPLPANWAEVVEEYYSIDSLYWDLNKNDLSFLVETTASIEKVLGDSSMKGEDRLKKADELYQNYHRISHQDFIRTLKWHENKTDNGSNLRSEVASAEAGYHRSSDASLGAKAAPAPAQASAPAAQSAPAAPASSQAGQTVDTTASAVSETAPAAAPAQPTNEKLSELRARMVKARPPT